ELAFDYPKTFFDETLHNILRPRPDQTSLQIAAHILQQAKRPFIIAGGGVRYAQASDVLSDFAVRHNIPISETIAGKGSLVHEHSHHVGPIGVIGSSSANALAAKADVIVAIGTRLQDFTTGSWTSFTHDARFIAINTQRWDATKHWAISVVGDARESLTEWDEMLGDWRVADAWMDFARKEFSLWNQLLDDLQKPTNTTLPTYAHVVGTVNDWAKPEDYVLTAAGGLPGELAKAWRIKSPNSFDCEFGFSCMGYEVAGGWGIAMANPHRNNIVMVGDGSYMMMNSDIYSTVLSGHKMIVIICDNGGFAVINRLQNFKGGKSFNNLILDCKVQDPFGVDFTAHAKSMGAEAKKVASIAELQSALTWAETTDRTTVITIQTDAHAWVPGDAAWDVGVPEISERLEVRQARRDQDEIRARQRIGV
ncbi:MAG: thiamine pyrophosphate-dependent enzyme, partial [Pseudomonadota bacterium]